MAEHHPDHVLILYASETGDAQDVAERVARAFRQRHRRALLLSMDAYNVADLPHEQLLVLITSTHGRGDPPPAMRGLWSKLIRKGLPDDIFEDVHYSLYGLGDSSYERFCFAGKMLARRMDSLGANPLVEPAWGDERAPDGIEETLIPWMEATLDAICPYLPGPSEPPMSSTALPPPVYRLEPVLDLSKLSLKDQPAVEKKGDSVTVDADAVYAPPGWNWATLAKNKRVTAEGWWQDVREIDLATAPDVTYKTGSICALQPRNSATDVDTFLELNGLEAQADTPVTITSTIPGQKLPEHLPSGVTSLRRLLTWHLDLKAPPRKSFFEWLRRFSHDEREEERLDEFVSDPDEVHTYATRSKRTPLETLADFRETKIPLEYVLEVLPPLRRRQFSIASNSAQHPAEIQLLVALVEYKTNLKIPRVGVCSAWLKTLSDGASRASSYAFKANMTGDRIPYQLLPPQITLPSQDTPVILVGPGTGVAPMRAVLEERIAEGAADSTALYFGCRSKTQDLYFASSWKEAQDKGAHVRIAFSRDQPEKVYVQDLIKQDAARVREWLLEKDGRVYVCGSSNAMPRQVREALAYCISEQGGGKMTDQEAEEYVDAMFDGDRGQEESW
ncbi:NADPH-ferrihemoprotein reductase [Trichosporon asahii var. asahii CBS 2479]|uniref:NADPH-dependent diflavin oxidoreductase 1 n=1 Tax=Trichosporon asahii var. asahii (strain ATCC 90039 / CBS 2479 / JCM 2466 / KCTC 7840 / NBRC 103889/ NCYC 2677 / UAMH 7654) TaxID=1186058 RepID=J6F264_TRIAS|nr:NADPH-ferrihemoprotein reductase [Trichosporon asahii var. asahii CBS 2479]EJT49287.1 NADPH-ferrihemoprotein reductase [Trichosporon asahii var. asahii CBS 2479]